MSKFSSFPPTYATLGRGSNNNMARIRIGIESPHAESVVGHEKAEWNQFWLFHHLPFWASVVLALLLTPWIAFAAVFFIAWAKYQPRARWIGCRGQCVESVLRERFLGENFDDAVRANGRQVAGGGYKEKYGIRDAAHGSAEIYRHERWARNWVQRHLEYCEKSAEWVRRERLRMGVD